MSNDVVATEEGEIVKNAGRYARQAVLTVFQQIGGVRRMAEWAEENPSDFYTKLFAKTITREAVVDTSQGVEDLLDRLADAEQAQVIDITPEQPDTTVVPDTPSETAAEIGEDEDFDEFY